MVESTESQSQTPEEAAALHELEAKHQRRHPLNPSTPWPMVRVRSGVANMTFRGTWGVLRTRVGGCPQAGTGGPARPPRRLGLGLTLLALIACAPQRMTVVPEALQGLAPCSAQVDPYLFTLTERWVTGGTAGDVPVGDLLRQVLVDDPDAPLRVSYVTSRLEVRTVVSRTWYRPHAYQARYRLTVRVEAPAPGVWQAWLQGSGESRSLAGPARVTHDAITQAVRELSRHLAAVR
jgi:hypothetical protein